MPTDPNSPFGTSIQDAAAEPDRDRLADDGTMTGAIADEAAERIIPPEQPPMEDAAGGPQADQAGGDPVPTEGGAATEDSEAHPS